MIIARFRVHREDLDLRNGYDRLTSFLKDFHSASGIDAWFRHASSLKERKTGWIPVSDEDAYLRRTAREMGRYARKWNKSALVFRALITSTPDEETYGLPGSMVVRFAPSDGLVEFKMLANCESDTDVFTYVKNVFQSACIHLPVRFGCCEYSKAPRPNGSPGETYYSVDHRVFPHREFLGWMGYVDRTISHDQIPEADELIAIPEKGTLIVSVADDFDVHNSGHLERAKRVEMRLVDLDALPVIDSRFK